MTRKTVTGESRAKFIAEEMAKKSGKKEAYEHHDYDKMSAEAKELALHADNSEHLYRSSHIPIVKNLQKKMAKGLYNQEQARKLWQYHADRAAHSYHKEHGTPSHPWHKMFPTETRREAAHHFESAHREQVEDPTNFS
jgi:hypothetical protein